MSFIPCVTLANLTTPVTNVGGGGGGGGSNAPDQNFSTITVAPNTAGAGITMYANNAGNATMYFGGSNISQIAYSLSSEYNDAATKYDFIVNTQPTYATGSLGLSQLTTLNAPNANLNISSINGAAVSGGGGAVASVSATAFNSILASPTTGAVNLALGAVKAAFPITTLGVVNLATTATVDIVELGGQFNLAAFAPGWYGICIPQISVCVGQNPVGTPNVSAVYPGASIQYQIVCGSTTGSTSTSPIHNYILVPQSNNILFTQTTPTTMVGIFYQPVVTGQCNTLKLKAFYNPPDAGGITAVGTIAHSSPTLSPGTYITILPLVAA